MVLSGRNVRFGVLIAAFGFAQFGLATGALAAGAGVSPPTMSMLFDATGDDLDLVDYDPADPTYGTVTPFTGALPPGLMGTYTNGNFQWLGYLEYAGPMGGENPLWTIEWDVIANADPFVINAFTVTNNMPTTEFFTLTVLMPIAPIAMQTVMNGSIGGSVTDNNGNDATVSTMTGTSMYEASIDGSVVRTLLDDPISATAGGPFLSGGIGPDSFLGETGPFALSTIAVTVNFLLSPGDSASFTAIFEVEIPGPAGLALLAVGGLISRRRRR